MEPDETILIRGRLICPATEPPRKACAKKFCTTFQNCLMEVDDETLSALSAPFREPKGFQR